MSCPLPPSPRATHKPDMYPRAKGVAPPRSTPAIPAKTRLTAACLLAACLASAVLLGFLISWTFSGQTADAAPSTSSTAPTPEPVADASVPPVPAPPTPIAVDIKVEPILIIEKAPAPAAAVKHWAGDFVFSEAKDGPETLKSVMPPDPVVAVAIVPDKAPVADKAMLDKALIAPPLARVEEKKLDPPVVDCTKLGTKIVFLRDPPDAFKTAGKERKLVFFVHLSGNFEDDAFT